MLCNGCLQQAGVLEEMLNDGLDSALNNEDMEDEIEEEVEKVLEGLAVETTAQLPATAARRERIRPSTQSGRQPAREVCKTRFSSTSDPMTLRMV